MKEEEKEKNSRKIEEKEKNSRKIEEKDQKRILQNQSIHKNQKVTKHFYLAKIASYFNPLQGREDFSSTYNQSCCGLLSLRPLFPHI